MDLRALFSRSSLRYAVVGALLLGLLLPSGLALLYETDLAQKTAKADLQRDLSRTADVLALSLAEPVWQVSPDLAEPMIKAHVNDPRFVSVVVREVGAQRPFLEFQREVGAEDLTLTEQRPIQRDGKAIASLTVVMTAAPYAQRLQDDLVRALWRSALTLSLSLALILWVMQRRVLQPMGHLTVAAEELAAGRFDRPLEIRGPDEVGRVGAAMERMRKALLSAFETLRNHAQTLEEQVGQRTAELTTTNAELMQTLAHLKTAQEGLVESQKLASLGRMVAGVAHELNTPLGNAMTVASTLEYRYDQLQEMLTGGTALRKSLLMALVQDTQQGHDILLRNLRKAADLVLNFKQVATDQTSDRRREFDLAEVIDEVLLMTQPRYRHTPFKIETQLEDGLSMDSYPGSLGQVLTNLLMNSLVHAFEGRSEGHVWIKSHALDGDRVLLTVQDDGVGMEDAVRRRIFDPFFTTKLGQGGSGLGMNIVHNIVTRVLGGQIEVSSTPEGGARFEIVLPRVAPMHESAVVSEPLPLA
ncbi:MAG: HAMP domain-containing protein [Burkholderiaceae bacterium]|nr:HAMP domain-containing protein [Burkholderiaceae bacterium]MBT9504454.1 HAMP domain-containing protein [Burkholderiaceae bacterium]